MRKNDGANFAKPWLNNSIKDAKILFLQIYSIKTFKKFDSNINISQNDYKRSKPVHNIYGIPSYHGSSESFIQGKLRSLGRLKNVQTLLRSISPIVFFYKLPSFFPVLHSIFPENIRTPYTTYTVFSYFQGL